MVKFKNNYCSTLRKLRINKILLSIPLFILHSLFGQLLTVFGFLLKRGVLLFFSFSCHCFLKKGEVFGYSPSTVGHYHQEMQRYRWIESAAPRFIHFLSFQYFHRFLIGKFKCLIISQLNHWSSSKIYFLNLVPTS